MHIFGSGMKAITGVMLIIICAMIPSSIILPQKDLSFSIIQLYSNWQIHGVLLTSLICGPYIGTISALTYLIIGLFYLPVFHGGGSVGYILTHEFGYLLGLLPAAWTCGFLSKKTIKANLINYSFYAIISLFILHIAGIIYLILGRSLGIWIDNLSDMILLNSLIPLPSQLLLCVAISLLSICLKKLLIIE